MKLFSRTAFLGAAGLVALSLPAQALGTTAADKPLLTPVSATQPVQLAARGYDPSAGSVGYKKKKKKKTSGTK